MTTQVGTLDINALKAVRFQSVAEFGMDTISEILARDLAVHNALVTEMVSGICAVTTDRQRIYGTSADTEMVEVDEYGRGPTQRILPGASMGFPLKLFQYALGWTNKWMQLHTPSELADQVIASQKAHLRAIQREIKKAIFLSTNYTFQDFLVDKVDLAVKRLINADSTQIPQGPNGETFDGATHTHYNGTASFAAGDLTTLIEDVVEHGYGGSVRLAINRAQETTVKGFTGFTAYADPRIIYRASDTPGATLDITRLDNRAIGIFGAAEVWVKPWVPAGYVLCWDIGSPNKPLVMRERTGALVGLRVAGNIPMYPLLAEYMEAEYGFGAWTRTNGAVLDTANASYTDPTIT